MTRRPAAALQPPPDEAVPPDGKPSPLERLTLARKRAEPVIADLLHSIQQDPPLRLDAQVARARRELDLLWQAVGRVTEP